MLLEFGFQIFPIETSRKFTYWEITPTPESISPPDVKMTRDAAQRRYNMFFCLPVFPMLRLLSQVGPDIEFPMVPIGYWTDARIQTLCNNSNNKEEQLKIKLELAKSTKFASNPVFQGSKQQESSFTKAVYNKPNLLEVAKRDGANLMPAQQALLFNVLTANGVVF